MRQIGVRDEAKMFGGYGTCGRPLCCTTFLNSFEPVSIKMAKQQDLSLNPSKLSGLCGRLKCCLRYELPNAKGVVHGGCGSEGGCDNPSGCGAGGLRFLRIGGGMRQLPLNHTRVAITVGRSCRHRARDRRARRGRFACRRRMRAAALRSSASA